MRVFVLSVLAAAVIVALGYAGLTAFQESVATAYSTSAVRIDWQEQSDFYGREVPPPRGTAG